MTASVEPAQPVARYERIIRASLARIWENVRDWEHLPWLHRTTFAAIRLQAEGPGGWRAEIDLRSGRRPSGILIEAEIDHPNRCYFTRTLEGAGAGTEIVTHLQPVDPHATRVRVAFHVPGVPADRAAAVGARYVERYALLWDEDEAMMTRRQALLAGAPQSQGSTSAPTTLALGPAADLRRRLPASIDVGAARVRLVDVDGAIVAFSTVCPHLGGPLDEGEIAAGTVTCPWHGYRFDLRTGRCAEHDLRMAPVWTVHVTPDGDAMLERRRSTVE